MIDAGSLEFAHARIWARHGQRPDEALWRRIESARKLAAVLDLARGSSLAAWVHGLGPDAALHAIDETTRGHWRACVAEVATWMPPAWGRAIAWCSGLVDLPALLHLARGGTALPWMADDAVLGGIVQGLPARSPLQTLLDDARVEPQHLLTLWQQSFQRCLPHTAGRQALVAQLLPLLQLHVAEFGAPQPLDGWALRRQLQVRLIMMLRRTVAEPAAAFVHLALSALEFERVRAELFRRAAFAHRGVAP